jgi:hypothetical protein
MNTNSPTQAIWNQRSKIKNNRKRILKLFHSVNQPTDLELYQWAQLMAFTLEFKPDIILELGRGRGNSTCAFTEVANQLKPEAPDVISICYSEDWEKITYPRVKKIVPEDWFEQLKIKKENILTFDYENLFQGKNRILLFWDAHGFDIAECVLGKILPLLVKKEHVVIMHDLSDTRYTGPDEYEGRALWKGNNWEGPRYRIGIIDSAVEQGLSIMDFSTRNKLPLHSSDYSFHTEFSEDQINELINVIGREFFSLNGHWFWFSLNEIPGPFTFPKFTPPKAEGINIQGREVQSTS